MVVPELEVSSYCLSLSGASLLKPVLKEDS